MMEKRRLVTKGQVELAMSKPQVSIPESQLRLKNDLELIRDELQAQTKAFQAVSHSVTLLEQESSRQQGRINKLEEEVQFAAHLFHGEKFDGPIQKKNQELRRAVIKEVEGLQGSKIQKQSSVENPSQDVLESKKFLLEELESIQSELQRIHKKLKYISKVSDTCLSVLLFDGDQEIHITRNFVSIKKMQANQMKCTKFLSQVRKENPGTEELNELWSAVNTFCNSTVNNSIRSDKRNSSRVKDRGSRHHRKSNSPGSNFSDSVLYQHRHSSSEHTS